MEIDGQDGTCVSPSSSWSNSACALRKRQNRSAGADIGLNTQETENLMRTLKKLRGRITIIYISHRIRRLWRFRPRTVLRDGHVHQHLR
jgi:hypothetical protein